MRKYDNYIGVDPGTTTGIAIWNSKERRFEYIYSGGILEVMKKLEVYAVFGKNLFVIENPNLRKWYGVNSKGKEQGAGSIKRDFSIWKEWFQVMDVEFKMGGKLLGFDGEETGTTMLFKRRDG